MTRGEGSPDPPSGHDGPNETHECPKCGDEFGCLPLHLPGCDG